MPATTPSSPQPGPGTHLKPFIFDLTEHEIRRMTAVLDAMLDWDPAAVLAAEAEALDPDADLGRRAWLPCPRCCCDDGCSTCALGSSPELHWRYLLANEARLVFLQCPGCLHRWWHDTDPGVGDTQSNPDQLPESPANPGQAA